jgi:hypothetical protein
MIESTSMLGELITSDFTWGRESKGSPKEEKCTSGFVPKKIESPKIDFFFAH